MIANSCFLEQFIPLGGGADFDDINKQYGDIDIDNEAVAKGLFKEIIKPTFESHMPEYKDAYKFSLSYYLTSNSLDFADLLESHLVPYDTPKDSRLFFIWLWEILFPGEDYRMVNYKDVQESDDLNAYNNFMDKFGRIIH